jgi:uncharacterized membrane protein HdeD (DUF308 family)
MVRPDRLKRIVTRVVWTLVVIVSLYLSVLRPEFVERSWRPVCAVLFVVGGCITIWMALRDHSRSGQVVGSIVGVALLAVGLCLLVGVYECGVDFRECK